MNIFKWHGSKISNIFHHRQVLVSSFSWRKESLFQNLFKRYQKNFKTYHFAVWWFIRLVIRCATENQIWHREKRNPEGCNFYHHFVSVICLEISKHKIHSKIKETSAGKKHGRHIKKYRYKKILSAHQRLVAVDISSEVLNWNFFRMIQIRRRNGSRTSFRDKIVQIWVKT